MGAPKNTNMIDGKLSLHIRTVPADFCSLINILNNRFFIGQGSKWIQTTKNHNKISCDYVPVRRNCSAPVCTISLVNLCILRNILMDEKLWHKNLLWQKLFCQQILKELFNAAVGCSKTISTFYIFDILIFKLPHFIF